MAWASCRNPGASASRSQSALETPTVIPQILWIAGLAAFVVVSVVLLVQALRLGAAGDLHGMAKLISTRSAEEEVEDEIRDLQGSPGPRRGQLTCWASPF